MAADGERYLQLLRSNDPEMRTFALRRLVRNADERHLSELQRLVGDDDEQTRELAGEALQALFRRKAISLPDGEHGEGAPEQAMRRFRISDVRSVALEVLRPSVGTLLDQAERGDYEVAAACLSALENLSDWSTVDRLIELLGNRYLAVPVTKALAAIGDFRALGPIVEAVERGAVEDGNAVIRALAAFRTRASTLQLVKFLRSPDPEIRGHAAQALGAFTYDEEVENSLINVLRDPDERVVLKALLALVSCDKPRVVQALEALFSASKSNKIRASVLSTVRKMKAERDHIALIIAQGLVDGDDRVRANAVEALVELEDGDVLRQSLEGVDLLDGNRIRANVAIGWGKVDSRRAIELLTDMVGDGDKWVRASAVYASRFVTDPRVVGWLLDILARDGDHDVLRNAVSSLFSLERTPALFEGLKPHLDHDLPMVRIGVIRMLSTFEDGPVFALLSRRYGGESDVTVKVEIIAALGRMMCHEAYSFLMSALAEPVSAIQEAAIHALDDLGRLESMPSIEPFVNSSDVALRTAAAVALWNLGKLDVVERLCVMLGQGDKGTILAAARALEKIGEGLRDLKNSERALHLRSALEMFKEGADPLPPSPDFLDDEQPLAPPAPLDAPAPLTGDTVAVPPPASAEKEEEGPLDLVSYDAVLAPLATGQVEAALAVVVDLLGRHDTDPMAHFLHGRVLQAAGRVDEARAAFQRAQEGEGVFFPASLDLARLHQRAGSSEGALGAILAAFRRKNAWIADQLVVAEELLAAGQVAQVDAFVHELFKVFPLDGANFSAMGLCFLKAKAYDRAYENLKRAYAFDERDGTLRYNLALACFHLGRKLECRALLDRLLATAPDGSPERERSLHLLRLLQPTRG